MSTLKKGVKSPVDPLAENTTASWPAHLVQALRHALAQQRQLDERVVDLQLYGPSTRKESS